MMCLDGFFVAKLLRRLLRPVSSSVPASSADRREHHWTLADTGRDDVIVLERSVHRQIMSEMDTYRTSLLHLQQVLLQQVSMIYDDLTSSTVGHWPLGYVPSLDSSSNFFQLWEGIPSSHSPLSTPQPLGVLTYAPHFGPPSHQILATPLVAGAAVNRCNSDCKEQSGSSDCRYNDCTHSC